MELFKTGPDTSQRILDWTRALLRLFPTRIPGLGTSASAAKFIAAEMRQFCDSVAEEKFSMHPGALFQMGRVLGVVYCIALALLWMGGICTYISFLLVVITFTYALTAYFLYIKLFDGLFKKRTGINAVGVVEPFKEARQQVILCGHHDSPYVFGFFTRLKRLSGIRFLLGILFFLYLLGLDAYAVAKSAAGAGFTLQGAELVLALAGILFAAPLFFFISKKESPGAGDNANGSSIALEIGRAFAREKQQGNALRHTRIVVLSTDGEEAGQRGAIVYAEKHRREMHDIPTFVLNIDSVYHIKHLAVMARDRHGLQKLSKGMAGECARIAKELGHELQTVVFPFGSGTDAAAFARIGVEAVTFIGMSASLFDTEHVYHTQDDTVEHIEPKAVEAVYNIAVNFIRWRDREC